MILRDVQKTLNKLGFGPLAEDGINGPKTTSAIVAFQDSLGLAADGIVGPLTTKALYDATGRDNPAGVPSVASGALKRIVMHWSAGGHKVSVVDKQHYHFIVSGDGTVVAGNRVPEDNISTSDGKYAAHTYMGNTGSIGVSMAAMLGAVESPFKAGPQPITPVQLEAFTQLVADLCNKYGIPVTRQTVLSHAEVQPTLGIRQRGKWDIAWIPGMDRPGNPVEVGDKIRKMIEEKL